MIADMKNALPALAILTLVAAVALPLLYLAAYYAMLEGRSQEAHFSGHSNAVILERETPMYRWCVDNDAVVSFFSIANALDTRLRPNAWEKRSVVVVPETP